MFEVAILVIIFNRPDFAKKIFSVLNLLKPAKLYVISDGPRTLEEEDNVLQSRKIFNNLDWDCEVKYNYSNVNLGLRNRISSGITWAFQNEEKLIILEDDCIPHIDFFRFCEELLTKYQDDTRIMMINGSNLHPKHNQNNSESYFFSKYAMSWGWATWKRAWIMFDSELVGLENRDVIKNFAFNLPNRYRAATYWIFKLNEVKSSKINSWAYRWMFTLWLNNGLAIVPPTNLIHNIGTDHRSTNTKGQLHFLNILTSTLESTNPVYPKYVIANSDYDTWLEDNIFSKSLNQRLIWGIKKVFKII